MEYNTPMQFSIPSFRPIVNSIKERFSQPQRPFTYVALGDSTVQGIGASHPSRSTAGIIFATILANKKNALYHNLGVDGARISEVRRNQLEQAIAMQPDLITISVGANDIRFRTGLASFRSELTWLLEKLRAETDATIVITTIPDLSLTPRVPFLVKGITNLMVKRLNSVITDLAKEHKIICIDMYHQSRVYAAHYPELIASDGFHPSDLGYALWANTIISQISHILFPNRFSL